MVINGKLWREGGNGYDYWKKPPSASLHTAYIQVTDLRNLYEEILFR
jgi:hypothetical protein